MRRRDVPRVLLASASAIAVSRGATGATPDTSQAPTAAERTAGVTPAAFEYVPGDVRRYGARGDGVTDDSAAFQTAINVAKLAGGKGIYAPTGAGGTVYVPAPDVFYLLKHPLDCTFSETTSQHGVAIRGDSGPSIDTPAIIACHTGHVFDLTGCDGAVLQNLNIGTDATTSPQTCFFLARTTLRSSSGLHRFRNVRVHGNFTKAILYNYGSESNVYSECVWYNKSTAPGTKVAVFSSHNIFALSSQFAPVAKGPQSCLDHQILGGDFVNTSADPAADVLFLDAANSLKIFGPWMAAGDRASGRALVYVDSTNGSSNLVEIFGLQGEVGPTQKYGVYFDDRTPNIATGWTFSGCYLPSGRYAIYAAVGATLDNFHVSGTLENVPRGIAALGTVQNSTLSTGSFQLAIGTSRGNLLSGDTSRWKIDRREHDSWWDSGAANRTWVPGTTDLTVRGKLKISEANCVFQGPLVTLSTTLTATESIECAAGVTLTGLPAAAAARSASVSVCDGNTGAPLGGGMVVGSAITLPEISARRSVVISATYFAT